MATRRILTGCFLGFLIIVISTAEYEENLFEVPENFLEIPYHKKASQLVAQSVMNFAHKLAVTLDTNEYPNTQIFSPLSIMSALSLLQMGSYGNSYNQLNQLFSLLNGFNSSTVHQEFGWLLEDVMQRTDRRGPHRPRNPTEWRLKPFTGFNLMRGGKNELGDHTVRVSNALFMQNGFSLRPDYAYAAQSVYKGEVTPLDFRHNPGQSRHYINSWVNQNTLGKIPSLIDEELGRDTNMILASTLYFQGFWEQVFYNADDQRKEAFYPDGPGSYPVGVTLMHTGGTFPFYQSNEHSCRIIGLPYKGNQTTMYIIQPMESTRLNLQQLQKKLTGELINELISKMEYQTATVSLPKFHIQNKINLKIPLTQMGIEDIFVNDRADLALIADPEENPEEAIVASSHPTSEWGARVVPVPQYSNAVENAPSPLLHALFDRYGEVPLLFSRFGEECTKQNQSTQTEGPVETTESITTTTSKVEEEVTKSPTSDENTTLPPSESTTEPSEEKVTPARNRREATSDSPSLRSLQELDHLRSTPGLKKPHLYVDEIIHKVDINVNEQGTEAAAATAGILLKTGPKVSMRIDAPFLILIQHDPTRLPLFYGTVNIPI